MIHFNFVPMQNLSLSSSALFFLLSCRKKWLWIRFAKANCLTCTPDLFNSHHVDPGYMFYGFPCPLPDNSDPSLPSFPWTKTTDTPDPLLQKHLLLVMLSHIRICPSPNFQSQTSRKSELMTPVPHTPLNFHSLLRLSSS